MGFWESVELLDRGPAIVFLLAIAIAFAFEFINGFHDTANAVATVIYTRSLRPTAAVFFSGFFNFLGVLLGGTAVAFGIVNLLPVDLLIDHSNASLVMVFALLISGVLWNLGTWYLGLPVSSSHTLIGSILGVGVANSLLSRGDFSGLRWDKVKETGLALLCSPMIGFALSFLVLLLVKVVFRSKRLYEPPVGDDKPPLIIRSILVLTCGGVSFTHGSNDGQKGMGLLLLVLVGFLPFHYSLDVYHDSKLTDLQGALPEARTVLKEKLERDAQFRNTMTTLDSRLAGIQNFRQVQEAERWNLRKLIFDVSQALKTAKAPEDLQGKFTAPIEFVPLWVIIGTAVALGIGTTVGYKRIVVTVAEKIGKQHLTYAQGAVASGVTAATILTATLIALPVSTTQILSSGVAGTMAANRSGLQFGTARKILLAWVFTLPATMILAGTLFCIGRELFVK